MLLDTRSKNPKLGIGGVYSSLVAGLSPLLSEIKLENSPKIPRKRKSERTVKGPKIKKKKGFKKKKIFFKTIKKKKKKGKKKAKSKKYVSDSKSFKKQLKSKQDIFDQIF